MGLLKFLVKNDNKQKDRHKGYSNELREYCEYQDKYGDIWNLYGKYEEKINYCYYEFINTNNKDYFNKLFSYCKECIELLPQLEKAKQEDSKINGTIYPKNPYCVAYEKLAKAYEKVGCYNSALNVCIEAMEKGYTDKTKSGFEGRIKRLEEKIRDRK